MSVALRPPGLDQCRLKGRAHRRLLNLPSSETIQRMNAPVLLLAAGRGERMRPLTDTCPKPLLAVQGQPLMAHGLRAMRAAQVPRVVVNTAWLGDQIEAQWGGGDTAQCPPIQYSHEGRDFGHALETAGGIARALPLLDDVFWVAAGDVWAPQFCFDAQCVAQFRQSQALAHIWLVPNPPHHPQGDYTLDERGRVGLARADAHCLTYSTFGLYRRELFTSPWLEIPAGNPTGVVAPLAAVQRSAMAQGRVTGAVYDGEWLDVGTPERLAALNRQCAA